MILQVHINTVLLFPGFLRLHKDKTNSMLKHFFLNVLGFNDMSTLAGYFVSSPRKREKRDRKDSTGDEWDGQERKSDRNESKETEKKKNIPPLPLPATRIAALAQL